MLLAEKLPAVVDQAIAIAIQGKEGVSPLDEGHLLGTPCAEQIEPGTILIRRKLDPVVIQIEDQRIPLLHDLLRG